MTKSVLIFLSTHSVNTQFESGIYQANACRLSQVEDVPLVQVTARIFYSTAALRL